MYRLGLVLLVAIASSKPAPQYNNAHDEQQYRTSPIPILKHNYQQLGGGYQYSYETGNGIQAKEHGFIKNKGDKDKEALVQQGTITYMDEHGRPITLTYIADDNGFQPQGAHLPTPPPSPFAEQKVAAATPHHSRHQQPSQHQHVQVQEERENEYNPYK